MAVSKEDVKNLVKIFEQSDWQEMRLEVEGLKLTVSKSGQITPAASAPQVTHAPVAAPTPHIANANPGAQSAAAVAAAPLQLAANQIIIKAPNLGAFWRQPKPGAPAYVEIGQTIDEDTTVCLIEVMKLFTPVKPGIKGKIVQCLVQDGEMVEYETPLFVVEKL